MILSRLTRNVAFNWKYAVGEILLIFIGISLSLLFDDWRQNRAKRESENAHLAILMESVRSDVNTAENALRESKLTLAQIEYLIDKLTTKAPLSDSIIKAFSYIVYNPQFQADRSGIKNIESAGLTTITDLNVRVQINNYYSRVQSNEQWSGGVQSHIDTYFNPRVITDFSDYMFLVKGIPYDYQKLQRDNVFLNALKRSQRLNVVSVDRIQTQKQHADELLQVLGKYLSVDR